ncbi:hypothetical protein FA95DRAFT_1506619, partial [Auriscalpium vulgare]
IDVSKRPEVNVDEWLCPGHANYKPDIAQAVFHYSRRAAKGDRFKVCIATADMDAAAWNHVHQSQLILDGTFGLSSSRLLLWIAMGIDSEGKGVPVAMFLFSAPSGTRATHAGYDTAIITELLGEWNESLNRSKNAKGRTFRPLVAITDTDTKERGALLRVWPQLVLLLCKFHVRQCWTNRRNQLLGKGLESTWKTQVRARIQNLESALLASVDIKSANTLIELESSALTELLKNEPSRGAAQAGMEFLKYMTANWMPEAMWLGWSQRGRNDAAIHLGIAVSGVLPTTNHLESFNGVLKAKHIPQWQHSGYRLRFDVLIFHLIHHILPRLFAQFRMREHLHTWKDQRFHVAAGGSSLPPSSRSHGRLTSNPSNPASGLAWFEDDAQRDDRAKDLYSRNEIVPIHSLRPYELWATCATSSANRQDERHDRYWLTMHASGAATCTCPDWLNRAGACKHLRALRLVVLSWMRSGAVGNAYIFPISKEDAHKTRENNRAWYGPVYCSAVTQPVSNTSGGGYCAPSPPPTMIFNAPHAAGRTTAPPSINIPPAHVDAFIPSLDTECELQNIVELEASTQQVSAAVGDAETSDAEGRTNSQRSAHHAVALQIQQQCSAEIAQLLPRLHGMAVLISDAPRLRGTTEMLEFCDVVEGLRERLMESLATGSSDPGDQGVCTQLYRSPPRQSRKRARSPQGVAGYALLPPSPEQRQKRKKSYKSL